MGKQEEIRQLIDTYVDDVCLYPDTGCTSESVHRDFPGYCDSTEGAYRCLLKRLGELGVVIKGESLAFSHPHLEAYFTVEPLIKEEK